MMNPQKLLLALCILAITFTFTGSWSCRFFEGASISFTGGSYGIWTLQDTTGKCTPWDVLFYSYHLDPALKLARSSSMVAMILGMLNLVIVLQVQHAYRTSLFVGIALLTLLITSIETSSIFNLWTMFWLFTYAFLTLMVRYYLLLCNARRISKQSRNLVVGLCVACGVLNLLTLHVLQSDYCKCSEITAERLERNIGEDACIDVKCQMKVAGYFVIVAALLWFAAATLIYKRGIRDTEMQPVSRQREPSGASPIDLSQCDDLNSAGDSVNSDTRLVMRQMETRGCCQRMCCDYRVSPRNNKERCSFWTFRILLGVMIFFYFIILTLMIGARAENDQAQKAPNTSPYFVTDTVCAFDPENPANPFKTFPSRMDAHLAEYIVAHCGQCGYCSNIPDIATYVRTRKTVAKTAKKCGAYVYKGEIEDIENCLEARIGFSPQCTTCWAENMSTTGNMCKFTCAKTLLTGFMNNNNVPGAGDEGWMNQCLFCDERISGPEFVTCSGVARRRLGIASEIERNPLELCSDVDVDWLAYFPSTEG